MIRKLILTSLAIVVSATASHSMSLNPADEAPTSVLQSIDNDLQLIGGKKFKRKKLRARNRNTRSNTQNFAGTGGTVMDTCPGGDHACINELKANCDKAGGGLSTEPDGGVDCFVVGIHDQ